MNKQSKHSSFQEKEELIQKVESILKDQLITEYEFYNYIKHRLAHQVTALPAM